MNYDRIPQELKELPQWVTVNSADKRPLQTGIDIAASSTKPQTWCSFNRAVRSVDEGERDYIGFVFADNGIVGIDIDTGYDEYGLFSDVAIDCMKACRSYTERSKSGRGMHIFLKGDLPFAGKNNGNGVEIYKTSRFFICTGDVLIFDTIRANQEAIDYIVSKYFSETQNPLKTAKTRLYEPIVTVKEGKVKIEYPEVTEGGRHQAMVSLAGQLWTQGVSAERLLGTLRRINESKCMPPLPDRELINIARSIQRYKR